MSHPWLQWKTEKKEKNGESVDLTISIGLASPGADGKTPEEVIKLADRALYQSKDNGRNCVMVWENKKKEEKVEEES